MTDTQIQILQTVGVLPERVQERVLDMLTGAAVAAEALQTIGGQKSDS